LGESCQHHTPAALLLGKISGTPCTGGRVGSRAGLEGCGKSFCTTIQSPVCSAHSELLYQLRYPSTFIYMCWPACIILSDIQWTKIEWANYILVLNTLKQMKIEHSYQSSSTQLIMFHQVSYMVTCFDHKGVIFRPWKYMRLNINNLIHTNTRPKHHKNIYYYYYSATYFGHTIRPSSVEFTGKERKKMCYRGSLPFTFNLIKYIKYYSQ